MKSALLLILLAASSSEAATRRLLVFGGGDYAPQAMRRFSEWSGGASGRVLFVPWASEEPADYLAEFKDALSSGTAVPVDVAPSAADFPGARDAFLKALSRATAVFFCGGDQNRIAALLKKEPSVREALLKRYADGVLFSGTSAGTAVMSEVMLTGEGDPSVLDGRQVGTDTGLGTLKSVILDQHFLARQRENRLFGAVLSHPRLMGLGVDSDAVLAVEDEARAEVVGPGTVMAVKATGARRMDVALYGLGEKFELAR